MVTGRIGALAAVALLAGGCTTNAGAAGALRPSGTSGTSSPQPTGAKDAESVLSRYRLFHQVFEYTLETSDPARIHTVASGPAAARLQAAVRKNRRAKVVQRGHAVPRPRLARLRTGPGHAVGTADIVDCVSTSGLWTYRVRSGERVGGPARPRRYLLYVGMTLSHGVWKVTKVTYPRDPRC